MTWATVWEIAKVVVSILPGGVIFAQVLRLIWRPRLKLFGRRLGQGRYRFSIHYLEDVPLDADVLIELKVLEKEAAFNEAPVLLCGPPEQGTEVRFDAGKDPRTCQIVAKRVRALSTWIVECVTNGREGDVSMTLVTNSGGTQQDWSARGDDSPVPSRPHFSLKLLATCLLLGTLAYWLPIATRVRFPYQPREWRLGVDIWLCVALWILILIVYAVTVRLWARPVALIEGYQGWERVRHRPATAPPPPDEDEAADSR